MPFPDEFEHGVVAVDYQPQRPAHFEQLAARLRDVLGPAAPAVDHVGATPVPGLAAKDCIDVQAERWAKETGWQIPPLPAVTGVAGRAT